MNGTTVTLTWNAPAGGCAPTSYVIQAGSASGLSNLATLNTGNVATTFVANGVAAGTYYLRVLASNANGQSAPSNEVVVRVGTPPPCGSSFFAGPAGDGCLLPLGRSRVAGVMSWNPNPCDYPSELWRFDMEVEPVEGFPANRFIRFTSPQLSDKAEFAGGIGPFRGEIHNALLGPSVRGRCFPTLRLGSTIEFTYNGDGTWSVVITVITDADAAGTRATSIGRATLRPV